MFASVCVKKQKLVNLKIGLSNSVSFRISPINGSVQVAYSDAVKIESDGVL